MENLEEIVPRYEFRAFANQFGRVVDAIRQRSACLGIRESRDIYLVVPGNENENVKIRNDQLDIKTLIAVEHGLEQWRPKMKLDFPAPVDTIRSQIFPILELPVSSLPKRKQITMGSFLEEVIWPLDDVFQAQVFKRRFFFSIDACRVEIAELLVNGAAIDSIAVEDEDPQLVLNVMEQIGLTDYENVSYLLALQRIMGMAHLSEPDWIMDEGEHNG